MLEDKVLISRLKHGSESAFRRIYEKHKNYLLTVAVALLNDVDLAEDVVHSTFVAFVESIDAFELTGSLKKYVGICVANRARNLNKAKRPLQTTTYAILSPALDRCDPERSSVLSEELQRVNDVISCLPYGQREVLILRLKAGLKFREIALLQNESINTVQSKYRYAIGKLRSLLNDDEVTR